MARVAEQRKAPGGPGIKPEWASSTKTAVGTAVSPDSNVWFTVSDGVLTEMYYPRVDTACASMLYLVVADGREYVSFEQQDCDTNKRHTENGVPVAELVNRSRDGKYHVRKKILTDPERPAVFQHVMFKTEREPAENFKIYAVLAPHIGNQGMGNTAWADEINGREVLFAQRGGLAIAFGCSAGWIKRSVGFVGKSDGCRDLVEYKTLRNEYDLAENGNVALTGQIDFYPGHPFTLAVAFGASPEEAAHTLFESLEQDVPSMVQQHHQQWEAWLQTLDGVPEPGRRLRRSSAMVLQTHCDKTEPGAVIASLSVPWGIVHGDEPGGYHLVWPRDLVEAMGAFLALGDHARVRNILGYLQKRQQQDGHWVQNMWADGKPYMESIQMDETALPIIAVQLARDKAAIDRPQAKAFWPMVRNAAAYLLRNGPVTAQDRWEQDPGYSPNTLAVEIAALLIAADMADENNDGKSAAFFRQTADYWNENVERWTFIRDSEYVAKFQIQGYYARSVSPEMEQKLSARHRNTGNLYEQTHKTPVGTSWLALVRLGLRAPHDPLVLDSIRATDAVLRVDTPLGPCWRRFECDSFGEHEDGAPYDGGGIGRAWPLLVGERAHYELQAGRRENAENLLKTMAAFANDGDLLPEQVWDSDDIPEKRMFRGRPTGSATPLVWAHAEYIKLAKSIQENRVYDMPAHAQKRYLQARPSAPPVVWAFNHKIDRLPRGRVLRIKLKDPAVVRWSADAWTTARESSTVDSGLGVHIADLLPQDTQAGRKIEFTFRWQVAGKWEGRNYVVHVV